MPTDSARLTAAAADVLILDDGGAKPDGSGHEPVHSAAALLVVDPEAVL